MSVTAWILRTMPRPGFSSLHEHNSPLHSAYNVQRRHDHGRSTYLPHLETQRIWPNDYEHLKLCSECVWTDALSMISEIQESTFFFFARLWLRAPICHVLTAVIWDVFWVMLPATSERCPSDVYFGTWDVRTFWDVYTTFGVVWVAVGKVCRRRVTATLSKTVVKMWVHLRYLITCITATANLRSLNSLLLRRPSRRWAASEVLFWEISLPLSISLLSLNHMSSMTRLLSAS